MIECAALHVKNRDRRSHHAIKENRRIFQALKEYGPAEAPAATEAHLAIIQKLAQEEEVND